MAKVLLVTGGRLGDIFGRRKMFLFGVVVFGASSALIGFSPDATWLVAFRAVQGVGAAFMMPATLSIISDAFPPHERGKAIGTWAGISALGLAIGPLVGGALVEYVSWQSIFFINVPVAIIAVFVTLIAARESRDTTISHRIDFPGIAAISIGLTSLVLALIEGNSWGWSSGRIVGLLVLAAVSLTLFFVIELRSKSPMLDLSYFKSRSFLGANIVAFIVSFAMLAMFFFLALYMQNVLGYSPLEAGARFLPATLVLIVVGPVSGRLTDKIGPRPLMTAGLFLVSISLFWQSFIEIDSSYLFLAGAFVVMGLGMGMVMSPMSTAAMNSVHVSKAGAASGVLSMSRMVGGTFGVAVMGAIVAGVGKSHLETSLASIPNLPAGKENQIADSFGGAGGLAAPGGQPIPGVVDAISNAFVDALSTGLILGSIVVFVGAITTWFLIAKKQPDSGDEDLTQPAADGYGPAADAEQQPQAALA